MKRISRRTAYGAISLARPVWTVENAYFYRESRHLGPIEGSNARRGNVSICIPVIVVHVITVSSQYLDNFSCVESTSSAMIPGLYALVKVEGDAFFAGDH